MNLREFKELSGLKSNRQVATALGTSLSTVDSWSVGRRNPSEWNQLQMSKFLEKQNAINARHAELRRARGISDSDFRLAIETGDC